MTGPDDTTPGLPDDATDPEAPIPRGRASLEMLAALAALTAAVVRVERVAMAIAAGLDAGAK